jgi:hypothetical protein
MNTRRYPRTLDQAFGPYNRSSQCEIVPMPSPRMHRADRVVTAASLIACLCLVAIFAAEYLAADAASNNQEAANVAMKE